MTISLKQLRYFDAVARIGSFGAAADACAITQPALSMQIQALERYLGVQLLERGRAGVLLTECGRDVAQRAAKILGDVRDIVDVTRSQTDIPSGPLSLGVIPSVAPYLLPALLPLAQDAYPDLDLHIRETQTHQLLHELAAGDLELLLLALPVEPTDIEVEPLFEDRFLLAVPAERAVLKIAHATPELLQTDRLLLLEEGHCLRDQALAFCNLRQVGNINTFGASSLSTIAQMVVNGLGMTLLPELCLPLENRNGEMHLIRFSDPEPQRTIGLAWRKSSPRKHHFLKLAETIRQAGERQLALAHRIESSSIDRSRDYASVASGS